MPTLLILLIVLHVLTGVFWAGSTFVLARTAGANAERLAYPQFGSAMATLLMGFAIWWLALRSVPAITSTHVLGAGVACALLAAIVQGLALPAVRRLQDQDKASPRSRVTINQRIAGALLVVTVACMALWGHI